MKYVEEIIRRIEQNCRDEFSVIWAASSNTNGEKMLMIDASKKLSQDINALQDQIADSMLDDEVLREVLKTALPGMLVKRNGLDALLQRLPPAYVKAVAANWLASKYVYEHGVTESNFFAFHKFMQRFEPGVSQTPPVSPMKSVNTGLI